MPDNRIQLAVIDMAGTTVADDGLVINAFEAAATAVGVPSDGEERERARKYVIDTMGQSKIAVFRALLADEDARAASQPRIRACVRRPDRRGQCRPIEGAAEAISRLRAAGVKVALTTGFSGTTQEKLLAALGWQSLADLALAPGDGVRGRPFPDLILTAVIRAEVDAVHNVAVLGDTSSDVESGRRAGVAIAAGILTGAHDEHQLRDAGATHVVNDVAEFADMILANQ